MHLQCLMADILETFRHDVALAPVEMFYASFL